MGKFLPGDKRPENSGRKEGTVNKRTLALKEILDAAQFCPASELIVILQDKTADLLPKERADLFLKLMEYIYPKRKAVEHSGPNGSDTLIQIIGKIHGVESES